ncbi:MAG TPA: DUF1844 domain-containing protein [Bacteroidota bacterium]|jgi:hypothetical protein|nr:DUF1844 domain-containing protein [Bacteroidota bacterium]
METDNKHTVLLAQLVSMFHFAALQHMGKLKSPMTDKIERDLPQSQATIEMLEMLHTKMKGNLTGEEEKMFTGILQELKLNYVDEIGKPQPAEPPDAPAGTQAAGQTTPTPDTN